MSTSSKNNLIKMNAEEVAVALDTAITAMDKRAMIEILAKVSNFRRMEIVQAYKMKFGKDVSFPVKNALKFDFEKVLRSLVVPVETFAARELHQAITGMKVNRDAIMEILCGFTDKQIKIITSHYELMYQRPESKRWIMRLPNENSSDEEGSTGKGRTERELVLGHSLEMDISEMVAQEYFKDFCVALVTSVRPPEKAEVNGDLVKADALALYNAGEGRYWWSDDDDKESRAAVELAVWIAVLTKRSRKHLLEVFSAYQDLAKISIEEAIKKQFPGDVRIGFSTLVKCITNPASYVADRLHYSMKGIGTDDDTLIRVVVCNASSGFHDIKKAFKKKYKDTLENWIKGDTSGDYRAILLSLVGSSQDHDEELDNTKQKLLRSNFSSS